MTVNGAIVRTGGRSFAIVVVEASVLIDSSETERYRRELASAFDELDVVLMSRSSAGDAAFDGRPDLVERIADIPLDRVPWQEIEINL